MNVCLWESHEQKPVRKSLQGSGASYLGSQSRDLILVFMFRASEEWPLITPINQLLLLSGLKGEGTFLQRWGPSIVAAFAYYIVPGLF